MSNDYIIRSDGTIKVEYIIKPNNGYVNKETDYNLYTYRNKGEKVNV